MLRVKSIARHYAIKYKQASVILCYILKETLHNRSMCLRNFCDFITVDFYDHMVGNIHASAE